MIRVPSDTNDFFDLFFVIGLSQILEAAAGAPVALHWDALSPDAVIEGAGDLTEAAGLVHEHARRHAGTETWVGAVGDQEGRTRGVLSPRVGRFGDAAAWRHWQAERHRVIDTIAPEDGADLRFVGGLGEPAYWCVGRTGPQPERGASEWEMKTRNRGEEFVQNRLHDLARRVSARDAKAVESGLLGATTVDEAGKNSVTSRTPTGLRPPGITDNARAWCALWGLSAFPVRPVAPTATVTAPYSRTAAAPREPGARLVGVPVVSAPVTLASYRAIVRGAHLAEVTSHAARNVLGVQGDNDAPDVNVGKTWLRAHRVEGVTVGRKVFSDNANAPEPWLEFLTFESVADGG